ncbi:hypothetical protein BDF20DRAFT_873548 [Mycotypha africana]|uniref:uncharacterized protein n=1 Tax=Mycotypha africana TaxID=64632 RepID=UPI002300F203|nr:uncharacterized protein BDF20DRAFT_873548 [Mycotypha africana]KAI8977207.1 hypothetical protein BDF20DRAFT_873548 [Mycotypha africana]
MPLLSSDEADKSFMSMLTNPIINPGPQQQQQLQQPTKTNQMSSTGPEALSKSSDESGHYSKLVRHSKELLTQSAKDKYLTSESDEPFEWIYATPIDDNMKSLPTSEEELMEMGLINMSTKEHGFKTKTLDDFFQHNKEDYKEIIEAFNELKNQYDAEETKVYLIGEMSIQVLILSLIKDQETSKKAIVGLKSLLVQT